MELSRIQRRWIRFLRLSLIGIIGSLAFTIVWTSISFHLYSPSEPQITIIKEDEAARNAYFLKNYEESRSAFKKLAASFESSILGSLQGSINIASSSDADLTLDYVYIPPNGGKKRLLIVSSGINGIDGLATSAIQRFIMERFTTDLSDNGCGLLYLHALNPWGMKHKELTTESGVSLQVNGFVGNDDNAIKSILDEAHYIRVEQSDKKLQNDIFNSLNNRFIRFSGISPADTNLMVQGQSKDPKAIMYSGTSLDGLWDELMGQIQFFETDYPVIMHLDLQTGFGERGQYYLFSGSQNKEANQYIESIFDGKDIYKFGDNTKYLLYSGFSKLLAGRTSSSALFLPVTIQFGTINSLSATGSIVKLHRLYNYYYGKLNGFESDTDRKTTQAQFEEMYNPNSSIWRSYVLQETLALLGPAFEQFTQP